MKFKKVLYVLLGCLCIFFCVLGTFLPVVPTVPFLIIGAFCFQKSSHKLHSLLLATRLYKNNFKTYIENGGMTLVSKIRIIVVISILMTCGFVVMAVKNIYIGCAVLFLIWLIHMIYFIFGIRTIKTSTADYLKKRSTKKDFKTKKE